MKPASAAAEAVTSHVLFGVSKNVEGSIFRGQDSTSKLFSDFDLRGPDDLRPPWSSEAEVPRVTIFLILKVELH